MNKESVSGKVLNYNLAIANKPFFMLAPMDDVTDTAFRQVIAGCAKPDYFMTEFVNVDGLQSPGRAKLLHKLKYSKKEKPIIAQIWGKNPDNFYKTAKELVKMGFDGVDINLGCPEKNVIKNGCCIALVNNRGLASEIITATREGLGGSLPLSVKTRLGLNEVDYSWHEFLLKQKFNMLIVHGRTAKQLSKVPADWEAIDHVRQLRDQLYPATLIAGNGDVLNKAHGLKLAAQHSLDGILIGRGIFNDPYTFDTKSPWGSYTKEQKLELYAKHVKLFAKNYPKGERKVYTLNKFCKMYIQGFDGAKELREKLMNAKTSENVLKILEEQGYY